MILLILKGASDAFPTMMNSFSLIFMNSFTRIHGNYIYLNIEDKYQVVIKGAVELRKRNGKVKVAVNSFFSSKLSMQHSSCNIGRSTLVIVWSIVKQSLRV